MIRQKKLYKINYIYYIALLVLLVIIVNKSRYFGVVMLYCVWIVFSQNIIYAINNKVMHAKARDGFGNMYFYESHFCSFWIDYVNHRLICLCLFNPFYFQSIDLEDIEHKDIEIKYTSKSNKYADEIKMVLNIRKNKYQFRIAARGRYSEVDMSTLGKNEIEKANSFFKEIDKVKQKKIIN